MSLILRPSGLIVLIRLIKLVIERAVWQIAKTDSIYLT